MKTSHNRIDAESTNRAIGSGKTTTLGLTSSFSIERLLFFGTLLIIGIAICLNDIHPYLPLQLSPASAYYVSGIGFLMMMIGGGMLLISSVSPIFDFIGKISHRLFVPSPYITCPTCGTRNPVKRYTDRHGCSKCGSQSVYCAKCGLSSVIEVFLSGTGCTHCGHKEFFVRK